MTPNDRNAPIPANRVIDEPWRTAAADALFARINELTCLARAGMNPADYRQPLASRLHRAEDLLPLTATTSVHETDTARRKKLIFAPGLGRDALAGRRAVLLDPASDTPAGDTAIERLDKLRPEDDML
ncbi:MULTISPECIES: hypothetical protein [Rhodococcus]|uniref:Uncharacterized protein n=1 Tax=Rhodococcus jostii TaxID=132919 RepID=A0A1H4JBD8_RHOJO|nr:MULTISPECIES: hypothetical protein [Rhodococcus]MDJ0418873.1 hypothetical protein [Rhodococcus opacus]SEB43286.1 hypothetical protein SAMN04490220_0756 [Rhodococcus jostii]